MNTKTNYQTLIAQINRQVEELAQATDAARMSEEMLRYLDAFSRFHRYSLLQHLADIDVPPRCNACGWIPPMEQLQPLCQARRSRHSNIGSALGEAGK